MDPVPSCQRCNKAVMSGVLTEIQLNKGITRQVCEQCVTSLQAWWYAGQLGGMLGQKVGVE